MSETMDCSLMKRRRTALPTVATINDLTGDNLSAIAQYLAKTSCALLAVALTAPSSSWRARGCNGGRGAAPSAASRAVLSAVHDSSDAYYDRLVQMLVTPTEDERIEAQRRMEELRAQRSDSDSDLSSIGVDEEGITEFKGWLKVQVKNYYEGGWEVLDFLDIERKLASELSDDDLAALLLAIDAKHMLKHLTLTSCFAVVGHGLEVLRQSKVLVTLEFSYLGQLSSFSSDEVFGNAKLSDAAILDIIDGIVCNEGHSLERLEVPTNFFSGRYCNRGTPNESFSQFMKKHQAHLRKDTSCCYFGTEWDRTREWDRAHHRPDNRYGFSFHDDFYVQVPCSSCNELVSKECDYTAKCSFCDVAMCSDCADEKGKMLTCDYCRRKNCESCSGREGAVRRCSGGNYVRTSPHRDGDLCSKCCIRRCRNPDDYTCPGCLARTVTGLLRDNEAKDSEIQQLRRELEGLRSSEA